MMSKTSAQEMVKTEGADVVKEERESSHPYAFHVSGPRNVASPNWKEIIISSWSVLFSPLYINI